MSDVQKPVFRSIRIELIAAGLLIPLAVVLGVVLTRFPGEASPSPAAPVVTQTPEYPEATVVPSPSPSESETSPVVSSSPTVPVSEPMRVGLSIRGKSGIRTYDIQVTERQSVAAILDIAERTHGVSIQRKDYGGSLGIFIEALNGELQDPTTQTYWHLYINGERSPLGASSATVNPGESVEWRLEREHMEEQP